MVYYSMFDRDEKRIKNVIEILDELFLGCGVLVGIMYDIDRSIICE